MHLTEPMGKLSDTRHTEGKVLEKLPTRAPVGSETQQDRGESVGHPPVKAHALTRGFSWERGPSRELLHDVEADLETEWRGA